MTPDPDTVLGSIGQDVLGVVKTPFKSAGLTKTVWSSTRQMRLRMRLLPGRYAVCRLERDTPVPEWARGEFVSVTRTPEELSVVCDESFVPSATRAERSWRCLMVEGPIPFETTGVAAAITAPLAAAKISVFLVATFDTDYLLVKEDALEGAFAALRASGIDAG